MKIETLKRSHLKRNIIIGVVAVLIISAIILNFTRAKYRVSDSIPLINGTINYSPYDIRVSSKLMVGDDQFIELDSIPTSSNIVLMSSTCTNNAILALNNNAYKVSNLTKRGTKCDAIYAMMDSNNTTNFDYTGEIQEFVAPEDGNYLLEVWGAQGGDASNGFTRVGGYGGYSKGIVTLSKNDKLYIGVGGKGTDGNSTSIQTGGYNGGGSGLYHGGAGGGATHIATQNGLLSTLANSKDSILIVAGGGGGGAVTNDLNCSDGGHGGGISGNDSTVNGCSGTIGDPYNGYGTGGTQTEGGTQSANYSSSLGSGGTGGFGLGATTSMNTSMYGAGGGGGGFYGGGSSTIAGAGGGSGYIANSLLSNKAMYCYNCVTSNMESTLTYSVSTSSEDAINNTAKEGNGFAKITLLNYTAYQPEFNLEVKKDGQNIVVTIIPSEGNLFEISKYYYTINDEYIESDSNTYTFESLEEGDYTVKAYIVDSKGITSEVKSQNLNMVKGLTMQEIIAGYNKSERVDFSTPYTSSTTKTVFTTTDWKGTSYYFAGNPTDNWVKFGGFYWRIIRVNGDGSVRLIYNGTSTETTGTGTLINNGTYELFNSNSGVNESVGLKYTVGEQHGQSTNSSILTSLDNWYSSSNLVNYSDYIDSNIGFCSDRDVVDGDNWSTSRSFYYAAYGRLSTGKKPSLNCSNVNDIIKVPVGLVTADEVAFAGGVISKLNSDFYLYNNQSYWTMTPAGSFGTGPGVFVVRSDYSFTDGGLYLQYGVRPVINLKANVQLKGSGTSTDPYVVEGTE